MEPFVGQIQPFAFNFPPRGWAQCDGQLLAIASYQTLFSLIGTTYGGDGRVNFALPDLRGRAAIHEGTGPGLSTRPIGQKTGYETTILVTQNMPPHSHVATGTVQASFTPPNFASSNVPSGRNFGAPPAGTNIYTDGTNNQAMASENVQVTIGNTGGGQAFNNMQPYLVINWCIALEGLYPPRS